MIGFSENAFKKEQKPVVFFFPQLWAQIIFSL